jgi:hypothetical protein
LLLAALLFPLDVMLRRLVITRRDWAYARAWLTGKVSRRPAAAGPQTPPVLGPLFQARDRARHRREPTPPGGAEVVPGPAAAPSPSDEPAAPAAPPAAEAPDAGDALARLREAKKRARRE